MANANKLKSTVYFFFGVFLGLTDLVFFGDLVAFFAGLAAGFFAAADFLAFGFAASFAAVFVGVLAFLGLAAFGVTAFFGLAAGFFFGFDYFSDLECPGSTSSLRLFQALVLDTSSE